MHSHNHHLKWNQKSYMLKGKINWTFGRLIIENLLGECPLIKAHILPLLRVPLKPCALSICGTTMISWSSPILMVPSQDLTSQGRCYLSLEWTGPRMEWYGTETQSSLSRRECLSLIPGGVVQLRGTQWLQSHLPLCPGHWPGTHCTCIWKRASISLVVSAYGVHSLALHVHCRVQSAYGMHSLVRSAYGVHSNVQCIYEVHTHAQCIMCNVECTLIRSAYGVYSLVCSATESPHLVYCACPWDTPVSTPYPH